MLKVEVWSHKDGDHLAIVKVPWWYNLNEWLAGWVCPCHGLSGWLAQRSDRIEGWLHALYSAWIFWPYNHHKEQELFKVLIEDSCVAQEAIWPSKKTLCWREDCPVHEHLL
jgi:hypothetical protein